MAISFVGSATGTNTIASMPAHQAGDLLLFFAFRDGSETAPSLPSGYTSKLTKSDGYIDTSCRVGYKIAAGGSETSGTWTNATSLICHVYRGVDQTTPLGGSSTYGHNNTGDNTIDYRTVTMTVTDGTSWLAGFVGHAAVNTNIQTAPTGMTNRTNVVDATDEAAGHDTNSGKTSWTTQTVSAGGTDSGWCSAVVEILAVSSVTVTQGTTFTNSNNFYSGNIFLISDSLLQTSIFTNSNSFYSGIVLPGLVRIIQLRSCENDSLLYLNGKIIGGEEGMYANLVTKSDYKSYMSINSTNQDAIIDFLIPKVSNFVKSYCRRTFVDYVANAKIENFNGGVPFFVVQEQPIIAIQDLFYSSDYGQTYTALTQYVDYIVDDANVIYPIASSEFRYSMRGYRLVYFAGYEVLPADLTLAIYDLLSYYIKNDVAVNAIKRTNTTSMQIEYITDTALPSNIKRVLDMYISDYN